MPEEPAKHCIDRDGQDATLRGAKNDLNFKENKTKQNKYLTEEAKNPYGRLQPTTSKKERRKEEETTKTTTAKQRNLKGCSLQT
jgi:hypothetical protein